MYSGTPQGGTVTLLMRADGRGIGCVRGIGGGIVSAGDIRYDGAFIYTEDGPLTVDSISEAEILAHISGTKFTLHRITETPAACRDVFPSTK
jgi:hypothetical protein